MVDLQNDLLPGVSTAMNSFIASVRLFLRDYPGLNRLLDGEETNSRMIAFSIADAISEFNSTPPPLRIYVFGDFCNNGWLGFLLKGCVKHILRSASLLQTRNHLRFSDGGTSAQVSDKGAEYMNYANVFGAEWDAWILKTKISQNIMGALGSNAGAPSEYSLLHGWNYYDEYY